MDLLFAITLMLLDEEAEPYHTSQLDADARYEEIINHENDNFHIDNIRMDKVTFLNLLEFLKIYGLLEDSKHVKAGQKLMVYLTVLKGNTNRATHNIWHRSGSTVSHVITEVAYAFERVSSRLFIDPSAEIPEKIYTNPKFTPYFNNFIGALDGCHFSASTSDENFRNRKQLFSQNVQVVVNFNLILDGKVLLTTAIS